MSEIKVNSIKGVGASAAAITVNNSDGTCTANITNNLSNRNKVINGSMICSQRGTSFSPNASAQIYTLDRFQHVATSGAAFDATVTQDSSAPAGFSKSYKVTPDATDTPSGGGNAVIRYKIEGQDLQDLAYGTSSAKPLTISFYAKTGSENSGDQYTLCIFYFRADGTGKTVSVAFTPTSTYQRFSFEFAGDTDATYGIRNSIDMGISIQWVLASGPDDIKAAMPTWTVDGSFFRGVTGQSNFLDNTNNEFYLTGVQLEVGSVATDFEHRSIHDELNSCYRYFYAPSRTPQGSQVSNYTPLGVGSVDNGTAKCLIHRPVPMRTIPTVSQIGASNDFLAQRGGTTDGGAFAAAPTDYAGLNINWLEFSGISGLNNESVLVYKNGNNKGELGFSAEL